MNTYQIYAHLDSLPTISQSQADNLKYDDGETRIWVSRMGPEDGLEEGGEVTIEYLDEDAGRWEIARPVPDWAHVAAELLNL